MSHTLEKLSELFTFLCIIHAPSSVILIKKIIIMHFTDSFLFYVSVCVCVIYIVSETGYQNLKCIAADGKYKHKERVGGRI